MLEKIIRKFDRKTNYLIAHCCFGSKKFCYEINILYSRFKYSKSYRRDFLKGISHQLFGQTYKDDTRVGKISE